MSGTMELYSYIGSSYRCLPCDVESFPEERQPEAIACNMESVAQMARRALDKSPGRLWLSSPDRPAIRSIDEATMPGDEPPGWPREEKADGEQKSLTREPDP